MLRPRAPRRVKGLPLLLVFVAGCVPAPASTTTAPAASLAPASSSAPSRVRSATAAPKASIAVATNGVAAPPRAPRRFEGGARAVAGSRGVVVSVESQATRAGIEILEAGGNAVDAAVAVAFSLAVTHPSAGNLGGGGFMLARPPRGTTAAVDFRETAPRALTRPAFDRMIAAHARGPAAAGVPGTVAGLLLAHERFGRLPRARVLAPAIALARSGARLGARQARLLELSYPLLQGNASVRRVFGEGKRQKSAGSIVTQPELAGTLERVARDGVAGFYAGESAAALVRAMGKQGLIQQHDLDAYRAIVREPLRLDYRGIRIETMPPPSAGGVTLLAALAALEKVEAFRRPAEGVEAAHLFLEISRRAQAVRRFAVVDPDTMAPSLLAERLTEWLEPTRLPGWPVDEAHATASAKVHPLYAAALNESENTTHLSVVDADGFVVSCTVTLSASFGSKVFVPGGGFFLNNAVASFGSVGDNQPAPGRRTTSSMAPTLLLDQGTPIAVLGTPGGDTIPSTLVQLVRHLVDDGWPLDRAVDAPRWHHGLLPDEARYESKNPPPKVLIRALEKLGHRVRPQGPAIGDAHSIVIGEAEAFGVADLREGGLALAAPQAVSRTSR
jgi:gamma-glutamyltranspeptidase/glutathione hydrolase